jgi:hypothetical protein
MAKWIDDGGAYLIRGTKGIDKILTMMARNGGRLSSVAERVHPVFDRTRFELVLALATDEMMTRYGDLAYSHLGTHRPDQPAFRAALNAWELDVVERYFPTPPARLLIGGAGGGREAFRLSELGYDVVAFEPSRLVDAMAAARPPGAAVEVYRASYEDLPHLSPVGRNASPRSLFNLPAFQAGILGWSSFSYVRTDERRITTLRAFHRAVRGPILVSFDLYTGAEPAHGKRPFRHFLPVPGRHRGADHVFSITHGHFCISTEEQFRSVVRRAGYTVAFLEPAHRYDAYAVLLPETS